MRLQDKWPNAILIHTPVHASWLNQAEIYFSIIQRKVLTPNDFSSLAELEQHLLAFQCNYERTASPFNWTFTRQHLHSLLRRIADKLLPLLKMRGSLLRRGGTLIRRHIRKNDIARSGK